MGRPLTAKPVRLTLFSEYSAWANFSPIAHRMKQWLSDITIAWDVAELGFSRLRRDIPAFAWRVWQEGIVPQTAERIEQCYNREFGRRAGIVANWFIPYLPLLTALVLEAVKVIVIVSLLMWQVYQVVFKKGEQVMAMVMHHVKGGGRYAERALIAAALLGFSAAGFVTVQWFQMELSEKGNAAKLDVAFEKIEDAMVPDSKTAGRSALLDTKKHGLVRVTIMPQKAE